MKVITHWALAFITAARLSFAHNDDSTVVQTLRLKQFELLQQTDTTVPSQDIAILEIDEATIEKYGQWPWKRTVLADIVVKLRESGAGIVVLPMVFSEEDRLGGDMPFIETIAGNGVDIAQVGSTQVNRNAVPRG